MNHKLFLCYWQRGLHLVWIAVLVTAMLISASPLPSASAAGIIAPQRTLTIEALVDGRSWLILQKNTLQWYHLDYAAPGRLEFQDVPTLVNGKEWFPVWPDIPDAENRDCYCYSSTFKGVKPVFNAKKLVEINVLQGRGVVSFVQYPAPENDNTLILEIDDNPYGGAVMYEIEFVFRSGGKP